MTLDIAALRRLHGEAVANKGGDFEIDTDEAFRIAFIEHVPALLDAAEERDRLRAMKDAEWEAAKQRYCDLPVSPDSMDTARAFVRRWFGQPNKDEETDTRELARMFDAVARDAINRQCAAKEAP